MPVYTLAGERLKGCQCLSCGRGFRNETYAYPTRCRKNTKSLEKSEHTCLKKHYFKEKMMGEIIKEVMGTAYTFSNHGYVLIEVPTQVMDILRVEREKHATGDPALRDMNSTLIGQINKEHDVSHLKEIAPVRDFLLHSAQTYATIFNLSRVPSDVSSLNSDKWDIELDNMWMNIQERGEYNPTHNHKGIISFVVWFEIPYNLQEEKELNNSKYSNLPANGDFFFHPIDILGQFGVVPMNVGKDKEGTICVFPAKLFHSVNPFFTTDKQRVTFSGNFVLKKVK
jgi:hypothetical protein